MDNIIVTYVAGSGGEMLAAPLINTGYYQSPVSSYQLNDQGRMVAETNLDFVNCFQTQDIHFYTRDWRHDWQLLKNFSPWLLLITNHQQVDFLKSKLQATVISLNYNQHLWLFVAESFCKKILDVPDYLTNTVMGQRFLDACSANDQQRQEFIELGRQGKLGRWYMDQLLQDTVSFPPKYRNYPGDVNIDLSQLLATDGLKLFYSALEEQLGHQVHCKELHNNWLQRQNLLKK
jgi:hypothetical protein